MKTTLIVATAFAFLLTGCQQKPDPRDAQIAALQQKITMLESNTVDLDKRLDVATHAIYLDSKAMSDQINNLKADAQQTRDKIADLEKARTATASKR